MRSTTFCPISSLAIGFSLVALACRDDLPTQTDPAGDHVSPLAAHSPAYLKGAGTGASILAVPAYTDVEDGSASKNGGGAADGALSLSVDVAGTIPRFPDSYTQSVAVFGYAWADLATGLGLVAVIHPFIGRDSRQNPDAWHTHPVQLTAGTTSSSFCIVSIGTSQAGIAIRDDVLRVQITEKAAGVSAESLDVVAAFSVQADAGCAATGLGVHILDAISL